MLICLHEYFSTRLTKAKLVFCFVLCLFAVGCSQTLKPMTTQQSANSSTSKLTGYILFGLQSDAHIEHINIMGVPPLTYSPKNSLQHNHFILAEIPVGFYAFSSVETGLGLIEADGDHAWSFKIDSQKINYVGHLELQSLFKWCHCYRLQLANKSSFAVEYLQQTHTELLQQTDLVYKGPGSDTFIDFAMAQYRARAQYQVESMPELETALKPVSVPKGQLSKGDAK
ncbi:hypothetical protein [Algibacillus agarilyticus]|uniref:hypothetical protein n=1 Tax=Algibacillus agarilyticus TaxID=2234133 RepID=UPI000DD0413C|nr:hypothetical protein [Algibacillus agarilyticus]